MTLNDRSFKCGRRRWRQWLLKKRREENHETCIEYTNSLFWAWYAGFTKMINEKMMCQKKLIMIEVSHNVYNHFHNHYQCHYHHHHHRFWCDAITHKIFSMPSNASEMNFVGTSFTTCISLLNWCCTVQTVSLSLSLTLYLNRLKAIELESKPQTFLSLRIWHCRFTCPVGSRDHLYSSIVWSFHIGLLSKPSNSF